MADPESDEPVGSRGLPVLRLGDAEDSVGEQSDCDDPQHHLAQAVSASSINALDGPLAVVDRNAIRGRMKK